MTHIRINLVSGNRKYGYSFEVNNTNAVDIWKKVEKLISDVKAEDDSD